MTTVQAQIKAVLQEEFSPIVLKVINFSEEHSGHASSPGSGESHFEVEIESEQFHGLSRIEQHRLVHSALADLLKGPVHALVIRSRVPQNG